MEIVKEPDSVVNEVTIPVDVRRKGISVTVGNGHWYKNWPYLKGHDPTDCNMWSLQQGKG